MHFKVYHQYHELENSTTGEDLRSCMFVCWVGIVGGILALVVSLVLDLGMLCYLVKGTLLIQLGLLK